MTEPEPFCKALTRYEIGKRSGKLSVVHYPHHRKRPSLVINTGSCVEVLASFASVEKARLFVEALNLEWVER